MPMVVLGSWGDRDEITVADSAIDLSVDLLHHFQGVVFRVAKQRHPQTHPSILILHQKRKGKERNSVFFHVLGERREEVRCEKKLNNTS